MSDKINNKTVKPEIPKIDGIPKIDDILKETPALKEIKKIYSNLGYFDYSGGSIILFIVFTIIFLLLLTFCFVMMKAQDIRDNWADDQCKPYILPFAGFINAPEGTSWMDYTSDNFQQCLNNVQSSIAGEALSPITFITSAIASTIGELQDSVNSIRAMFDKVRTQLQSVVEEIMGRLMNIIVPIQTIILALKDFIGKLTGVLTTCIYMLLAVYYNLQSLMGASGELILEILMILAGIIAVLWAVPVTWAAAISMSSVFISIAIPMAILFTFMELVLKVKVGSIPTIKCFDKNTQISMHDGTSKKISELVVGDRLDTNNSVCSIVKVTTKGSVMYNLNDVIVSDSHIVRLNDKWVKVCDHPQSVKLDKYDEEYLYCINTNQKLVTINNTIFADWDDLYGDNLYEMIKKTGVNNVDKLHTHVDGGFCQGTLVTLNNGHYEEIQNIKIGDILQDNNEVYGIVEIDPTVLKHYKFNLGNVTINGAGNLNICELKMNLGYYNEVLDSSTILKIPSVMKENGKLYHLLTTKKMLHINNTRFFDYNAGVDLFLAKTRGKLLSMKYV